MVTPASDPGEVDVQYGIWVALVARLMESAGVLTMLLGTLVAAGLALGPGRQRGIFKAFRQYLGRAILLGLEFLVAADIIRTVSEVPTLQRVIVLAVTVTIRTFLSFTRGTATSRRKPQELATGRAVHGLVLPEAISPMTYTPV